MTTQSWAEQGPSRCQSELGKSQEASALHKEVQGNSLLQGRAHELVTQYQMASPENTHTNDTTRTEQGVFMYLGINGWTQQ